MESVEVKSSWQLAEGRRLKKSWQMADGRWQMAVVKNEFVELLSQLNRAIKDQLAVKELHGLARRDTDDGARPMTTGSII